MHRSVLKLVYTDNEQCRDSSVGIATRYGLDGSGDRTPVGGEILRTRAHRPWGPPNLLHNGYQIFPEDKAAGALR